MAVSPTSPAAGPYGTYTPQSDPLTPAGMRRLDGMFTDIGRILRRGWWRIATIALLVWGAWSLAAAAVAVFVVDTGRLVGALAFALESLPADPARDIPPEIVDQIERRFADALNAAPPARWLAAGLLICVAAAVAASYQTAAVNRIGMDAAAGRPLSLAAALRSGVIGGLRILGWISLLGAGAAASVAAGLAATWAAAQLGAAPAVLLGSAWTLGMGVLGVWLGIRLWPLTAQAVVERGALRWAWQATRGRFWAVLGRGLVWVVAASVGIQLLSTALLLPATLLTGLLAASGDPATVAWSLAAYLAVSAPVGIVLHSATTLGVVPIWRDLTTDADYQAAEVRGS